MEERPGDDREWNIHLEYAFESLVTHVTALNEGLSVSLHCTDVVDYHIVPALKEDSGPVFLIVVDCMRLDQWLVMEELLTPYFSIQKDYYFSILPTATPYARNAIFAGLFPSEIEAYYPDLWQGKNDDDHSQPFVVAVLREDAGTSGPPRPLAFRGSSRGCDFGRKMKRQDRQRR